MFGTNTFFLLLLGMMWGNGGLRDENGERRPLDETQGDRPRHHVNIMCDPK